MSSLKVEKTIKTIGRDIKLARKRRRMSIKDFAERVGTSEATIMRLEGGDPGVRLEVFVSTLSILGKLAELGQVLDPGKDDQGLMVDQQNLPKRISSVTSVPRFTASSSGSVNANPFPLKKRLSAPGSRSKPMVKRGKVSASGDQNDEGIGF